MNPNKDFLIIDYETWGTRPAVTEAERRWATHPRTIKTIALLKWDMEAVTATGREIVDAMMVSDYLLKGKE